MLLAILLPLSSRAQAPVETYRVVATLPHSTENFTEGFFYLDGLFYEGVGLKGHSGLLVEDPRSGRVVRQAAMTPEFFGEGIAPVGNTVLQWTWVAHLGFVYDRRTLRLLHTFRYTGEGWGMTSTGRELVTSNGTDALTFRNPQTFAETRHITVHDGEHAIGQVNELEWVRGEIYANVWHSNRIARVSPKDGHVIAWVDLTGLLPASEMVNAESVLNGIAYDPAHDRLFVTGKQWPHIFQIKVVPR